MAKLRAVPRRSDHRRIAATGTPSASTGTIDEYWLSTPTATTDAAASGAEATHSVIAAHTPFHWTSASSSARSPSTVAANERLARASTLPSESTSVALTLVVPTSIPRAVTVVATAAI